MPDAVDEYLLSAEDLVRRNPGYPCELVRGRILRMSPTGREHTFVVGFINRLLTQYVLTHQCGMVTSGEGGYLLSRDPDTVRAPDLAWLSPETLDLAQRSQETFVPRAPDLAVEVLSPQDAWAQVEQKAREYLAAGARAVWVANPGSRTLTVFQPGRPGRILAPDGVVNGDPYLPGFEAEVRAFFE